MSSKNLHLVLAAGAAAAAASILVYLWTRSNDDKKESKKILKLPVIDFNVYLNKDSSDAAREAFQKECSKVSSALHEYGICIVKDPRVNEEDNNRFLDMMENYFTLSDGVRDARPEVAYQIGVTKEFTEKARDNSAILTKLEGENKAVSPIVPVYDAKWRFFWRIGPRPEKTKFPALNMDAVIPPEIPDWKSIMDTWGNKMLTAVTVLAEMAAVGFDLPADAFTSRMHCGPHLLAPTGSDYSTHKDKNCILAGFHTDLNFLTIHGKSRYPGLYIWTRSGERMSVVVPQGCLLVQAGKQIEYLTGGHVLAGFHEVVIDDSALQVIAQKKAEGKSLWRVSSTLFSHIQSDQTLEPLGKFATQEAKAKYIPKYAGNQVREELEAISLAKSG